MKQRLVGTLVIGCLAIIFIPVLLDGEGVTPPELGVDMPPTPPLPETPRIQPQRPEIAADTLADPVEDVAEAAGQEAGGDIADATPPAPEPPRLDESGLPETWSVRLGSFGEPANAEALVARLRNAGYKGYSRPLQTSRGPLTGVYVGPVLTESAAADLRDELAGAFDLEGVVVQFAIEAPDA